ncbi:MAG TPA: hypothetical protein VHM90_07150 [Phycisphaerae bacterium]|nr:hypothetical protein [Phycisphaerae bacterium]
MEHIATQCPTFFKRKSFGEQIEGLSYCGDEDYVVDAAAFMRFSRITDGGCEKEELHDS